MKDFINQDQIIRQVRDKTGFSLKALKETFDAIDDVIVENMLTATQEHPSEIRLFPGWRVGAKILPEREVRDPRNGEKVITPEKFSPYCTFEQYYRQKINNVNDEPQEE